MQICLRVASTRAGFRGIFTGRVLACSRENLWAEQMNCIEAGLLSRAATLAKIEQKDNSGRGQSESYFAGCSNSLRR